MSKTSTLQATTIGVAMSERIVAGLITDHKLAGPLRSFPEADEDEYALVEMHADNIARTLCEQIILTAEGRTDIAAVGIGVPGLIRKGVVEEAPNLPQLKGSRLEEQIAGKLREHGLNVPVTILNDADAMAYGLAATSRKFDRILRVWTLGVGVGYGRYPCSEGVWEGGHTVVTLDEKERFCGCGGRGHLEGIMGHRAMRLRFLDMEPDEVFEEARAGNPRCLDFKKLWHAALAAATATSIHQAGTGKFYLTGADVRFVDLPMLKDHLQQMVKMSPLLSYSIEIVEDEPSTRVLGAAHAAHDAALKLTST